MSSDVIIRAFSSPSRVASSSGAELRGDDVEVRASNDVGGSEMVSTDNGGRLSCKSDKPSLLAARLALLYNSEAATALELTGCRGSVASAADLVDLRAPVSSLTEVALNIGAFNCVTFLGDIFGGRLKVFGVSWEPWLPLEDRCEALRVRGEVSGEQGFLNSFRSTLVFRFPTVKELVLSYHGNTWILPGEVFQLVSGARN